jgi:hypothetical protein
MLVTKKNSKREAASPRSAKKAAPARGTKAAAANTEPHPSRRRKIGVTSAVAMKNLKRFGSPNDRLQERLKQEAKRELSPLAADEKLLNVRQAAARLNISHHTVRSWALDDKMIYRRIGGAHDDDPRVRGRAPEKPTGQLGNPARSAFGEPGRGVPWPTFTLLR